MQLARNLYLGDHKTFKRKVEEIIIAERLSESRSKNEILTDYLNTVPYGNVGGQEAYGVQAAARIFFNEPASALTLVQAALLAGLPQAPSDYNPFDDPAAATTRDATRCWRRWPSSATSRTRRRWRARPRRSGSRTATTTSSARTTTSSTSSSSS